MKSLINTLVGFPQELQKFVFISIGVEQHSDIYILSKSKITWNISFSNLSD